MIDGLLKELKEVHGKNLDLSKDEYYLFFRDGVLHVYLDEDEGEATIKVDVRFLDEESTYVYTVEESIEDYLG